MTVKLQIEFSDLQEMSRFLQKHTGAAEVAYKTILERVANMDSRIEERLQALRARVERLDGVEDSARALIEGIPQVIAEAVAKARAEGVTEEQLAVFDELNARLTSEAESLAAAIKPPAPPVDTVEGGADTVEGGAEGDADTVEGGAEPVPADTVEGGAEGADTDAGPLASGPQGGATRD